MSAQAVASSIEQTHAGALTWRDAFWERVGPVSGFIAIILTFAGNAIADPNSNVVDADPAQDSSVIANLFTAHRADMEFGARFQIVGIVFMIVFLAYLYRRIQSAEAGRGWLAPAMLIGGVGCVVAMLMFTAATIAIATIDDYGTDTAVARTFAALTWDSIEIMLAPAAALAGSIAVAALRYNALPRWIGYTGAPLAFALLIAPLSYAGDLFWFAFIVFWFWLLAVSIDTAIRPRMPEPAAIAG